MSLQKQHSKISLFIAAIFSITILPFNAFHSHEADEHYVAVASHNKSHRCELDRNFCKGLTEFSCGHEKHFTNPVAKCFTCQFHFEKSFYKTKIFSCNEISFQLNSKSVCVQSATTRTGQLFFNKGPPIKLIG